MIRGAEAMEAAKILPFETAMKAPSVWFEASEDEPADPVLLQDIIGPGSQG